MTDRRDPIETWLSADVELMPPPPGSFERVHRRARQRRTMKALTAAAAAAVVIAGGVVIPQLAGGFGTNTSPAAKIKLTLEPRQKSPAPTTVAIPGPPLSPAPGGPPPAAGFLPTSVTFIGGNVGAVIGVAGSCATGPCTAMAATHDYGKSWSEIGAPPAGPADGRSGVSQVRFLDFKDGWAYGPALYVTHDGAKSWRAVNTHDGRVIDLSTVGRRAFAVVGFGCTGAGDYYAIGCTRFRLFATNASGNEWDAVPHASGAGQAESGALQLTSERGYLLAGGRLYTGPAGTGAWHRVSAPLPACIRSGASGPQLIAPATSELFLVCQDPSTSALTLYRAASSGSFWQRRGMVEATGGAKSLAVTPSGTLLLATTTGIYRSADGRTWSPVLTKPTGGFGFVGMTNDTNGVAIAASLRPHVYVTTDGGRTWQARSIR